LELANNIEANKSTDVKDPKFKQDRQALKEMYKNALPSLELVRRFSPENKEKWAAGLYRIYLNLNMGEKFDEIDKLIKK
ncbi:MAG: hypothetical protein HUK03_05850, partial [Bacteroidaceae bacterium]|nr:hypothetical protein [Bacteroidaceae bacterium]